MIREIKFRGKRIDNGEWVYGNLFEMVNYLGGDTVWAIQVFTQVPCGFDRMTPCFESEGIGVLEETIGQYTGLKDKNGVEIWEGDIVKYTESYGCSNQEEEVMESVVKIHSTHTYPFSNVREIDDCWYSVEHSEYEVIGSIHEGEKANE